MNDEATFLQAMQEHPEDTTLRLVFADWLEERGDPRGELLRLLHTLTRAIAIPDRDRLEERLRSLVAAGVQYVGPFFTNRLGMRFSWIPAGTFLMGSPKGEKWSNLSETQHPVTLTRGFYLGIHPVTRRFIDPAQRSENQGDDLPAVNLSWQRAHNFVEALSEFDDRSYRLPTEAQWEYACRAGTTTSFHFGKTCNGTQANCDGDQPYETDEKGPSLRKLSPVGSYAPNAFGLYDMHGNVLECCSDWYRHHDCYAEQDPRGPKRSEWGRVVRGGCSVCPAWQCRSAWRHDMPTSVIDEWLGCRVSLRLPKGSARPRRG